MLKKDKLVILFTCFNRKDKTEKCINSLVNNKDFDLEFIIVDDGSTDGTKEMFKSLQDEVKLTVLDSGGDAYYSGGMRIGMEYIKNNEGVDFNYVLLVNDDVLFCDDCIDKLVQQNQKQGKSVTIGATCDSKNQLTYGLIQYTEGIRYNRARDIWRYI